MIPTFIQLMIPGEPPMIYGDGRVVCDVTQIDNVVANLAAASPRMWLLALFAPRTRPLSGRHPFSRQRDRYENY